MPKLLFKGKENQDEKEYLSWKHFCNNNAFHINSGYVDKLELITV